MTPDVATLQIRVLSDGLENAKKRLDEIENSGKKAERATDGVGKGFKSMASAAVGLLVPLGIIGTTIAALSKLVSVTKEFGTLSAQLKTATGSAANALIAFKGVQQFASDTPYALAEATTGFLKLVNYGLDPSTRALTAWGDMASAQGKGFVQLIEAVADATQGQWQRMKEGFSVSAKAHGDMVDVTFRGMTTTIKNNSAEIEKYLLKLAENNFGGAMKEQMAGLGGVLANVGDSWDMLFLNISQAGLGDVIKDACTTALGALNELNAGIASGETGKALDAYLGMWSASFKQFSLQARTELQTVTTTAAGETTIWGTFVEKATDVMSEAFAHFPLNVSATMEVVGAVVFAAFQSMKVTASSAIDVMINEFKRLISIAGVAAEKMKNPLGASFGDLVGKVNAEYDAKRNKIIADGAAEIVIINNTATAGVKTALEMRDDAINDFESKLDEAAKLRKKYEADIAGGKGTDTLAPFRIKGSEKGSNNGSGAGGGASREAAKAKRLARELEQLRESLRTQEESVSASYDKRLVTIQKFTEEGSASQMDMMHHLTKETADHYAQIAESYDDDNGKFFEALAKGEELLKESYERRKKIIQDSDKETAETKAKMMTELETQYATEEEALAEARRKKQYKLAADFFGNLSAIAGAFGKKGFKIAQGLAIAEATVNTASAAIGAYKALVGIPYVGPYLAAAAAGAAIATGAGQIAKIKSTQYQGAFEHGGMISANGYGLVGEAGPELVQGPAMVTSARTTADKGSSKPQNTVTVNVFTLPGQTAETKETTDPNGNKQIEVIIKKVEAKLTSDARSGGGTFVPAMQQAFKLSRA